MIAWLTGLFSKTGRWVLGVVVSVLLILSYITRSNRKAVDAERDRQQSEQHKETIKRVKVAHGVDQSVNAVPDADIDKRMREQGYFRDE